ncbi:hypothetical protein GCM10020295_23180 [Streptomyces cinereospinus]
MAREAAGDAEGEAVRSVPRPAEGLLPVPGAAVPDVPPCWDAVLLGVPAGRAGAVPLSPSV